MERKGWRAKGKVEERRGREKGMERYLNRRGRGGGQGRADKALIDNKREGKG